MTDNEIKKALEYCKEQGITSECEKCNIKEDCRRELIAIALDLINRNEEMINGLIAGQETLQKGMAEKNAEIERLQKEGLQLNKTFMDFVNVEKFKAIKEFAERLKKEAVTKCNWDECVDVEDIDNLLKEMEGETNGKQ